jgi:hypothetical protein
MQFIAEDISPMNKLSRYISSRTILSTRKTTIAWNNWLAQRGVGKPKIPQSTLSPPETSTQNVGWVLGGPEFRACNLQSDGQVRDSESTDFEGGHSAAHLRSISYC